MNLKLLDTGFVNKTNTISQTQLGVSDRAGYDGSSDVSAFTLKVQSLSLSGDAKLENKSIVSNYTDVESSLVSNTNRTISVSTILKKEIVTANYDKNNVTEFLRMERTRGVKLLYPDGTSDDKKTIIEALGAENTGNTADFASASPSDTLGTVSTTTPYITGRVRNISVSDTADGDYWRITFNFNITG